MIEDLDNREPASVCVSFGEADEVMLDMCVLDEEYDIGDEHVLHWNEVKPKDEQLVKTDNSISIISCADTSRDKRIAIYYGDWAIRGRWESMEQIAPFEFVYHCRNSLFRFNVIFNIERYTWDGDYESLLHD